MPRLLLGEEYPVLLLNYRIGLVTVETLNKPGKRFFRLRNWCRFSELFIQGLISLAAYIVPQATPLIIVGVACEAILGVYTSCDSVQFSLGLILPFPSSHHAIHPSPFQVSSSINCLKTTILPSVYLMSDLTQNEWQDSESLSN